MFQTLSSDHNPKMPRTGQFLGIQLLAFLFVLTSLPIVSTVHARHATPSEAALPHPEETPTPTPTPTPTDEELKLDQEKKILDKKKDIEADKEAIVKSQKAQLEAKFPKPTTSPLAGTTTINDGAVIETQIVSYVSMAKAANRIIDGIKTHVDGNNTPKVHIENLAVYNERDINLFLSYKVANNQIASIKRQYCLVLDPLKSKEACATPTPTPPCPTATPSPTPEEAAKAGQEKLLPAIAGLSIAQSFLGAFVDFTALLRTNVDIKGMSFDIDEGPLVAEVFRAARRPSPNGLGRANLYYPYVFLPDLNPASVSALLDRLEKVHTLRIKAGKLVSDLEKTSKEIDESKATIKQLKAAQKTLAGAESQTEAAINNLFRANFCPKLARQNIDILEKVSKVINHHACPHMSAEKREFMLELAEKVKDFRTKLLQVKSDIDEETANLEDLEAKLEKLNGELSSDFRPEGTLDDALAQLKTFNAQFDSLVKSLIEVDAASGANPLTNYIRVENLMGALPLCGSYWLQLRVLKAGGNNRIKTNLITDIFTAGNRISHSGGVIVQYHLFDAYGRSVASDTITQYTNYIKANKVKDIPRVEIDETP